MRVSRLTPFTLFASVGTVMRDSATHTACGYLRTGLPGTSVHSFPQGPADARGRWQGYLPAPPSCDWHVQTFDRTTCGFSDVLP